MLRLNADSFDWLNYRNGWLTDLGVLNREMSILENVDLLRKAAVGYLEGEHLMCRPQIGEIAVLFEIEDSQARFHRCFWTHVTKREFDYINQER